ncbi:MAG: ABC transporter permease [Pseudomonadota bacterium]
MPDNSGTFNSAHIQRLKVSQEAQLPKFQALRVISALMIREMITRYGRSWGGYFWAVAEPVGMIAMLSLAFSQFLKTPPLGSSFMLFYAAGYLPFSFYMTINSMTSQAVSSNRQLMQYPMVTPMDAIFARCILQVLTMIVVTVIILVAFSYVIDERITISMPEFISACLAATILGLGGGTLNVVLFTYIPSYKNVWSIISRPLFLVSGIFYTVETMPANVQTILLWNPLVHVTGEAHKAFYPTYNGDFVILAYPIGLGVLMFMVGAGLIMRNRGYIIENA